MTSWCPMHGVRDKEPGTQCRFPEGGAAGYWCLRTLETVPAFAQAKEEQASDVQVGGEHYKNFAIQPAEFSTRNGLGFLEGCVVKRVCRYARGGKGVEDLDKAIHELELLKEYAGGY